MDICGNFTIPSSIDWMEPIEAFEYMESAGMVTITALKDKNHKGGVIPSKFHHLPVTGLSGWAFSGCENLTIDTPSIAYAAKYAEEKGIPMCT